jgi:hypothetical protein
MFPCPLSLGDTYIGKGIGSATGRYRRTSLDCLWLGSSPAKRAFTAIDFSMNISYIW